MMREDIIDPDQIIIDAHHHLYERPDVTYRGEDYLRDVQDGHDIRASVFVQARGYYRDDGLEALRPVGETEYAAQVAEAAETAGGPKLCAGIVAYADLMLGEDVRPVLEAHGQAGKGRLRGIRHILAWDADQSLTNPAYPTTEDMMASAALRKGFAQLAPQGLSFDAWLYFPQIPGLIALAQSFPDTTIVLNHCGGVLRTGAYAHGDKTVFVEWRKQMTALSAYPNVFVKLGGLGMALSGFGFQNTKEGPSSADLAQIWKPWIETCIDLFGPDRAMFESNFPADRLSYAYPIGWNALKRLSAELTQDERDALFFKTAARVYRIEGF